MPTNAGQVADAGTPDPLAFPKAHPIAPPGEAFGPSFALSNTLATTVLVPIAGAFNVRLRGIINTTEVGPPNPVGVLSFVYRRPPPFHATGYSTGLDTPHAAVNITAATEFLVDVQPHGECLLAVTFTPAGGVDIAKVISVTFLDVLTW